MREVAYMGRLNAVLNSACRDVQVLLYYPIYDLWVKYLTVARPLKEAPQLPHALRIMCSFMNKKTQWQISGRIGHVNPI